MAEKVCLFLNQWLLCLHLFSLIILLTAGAMPVLFIPACSAAERVVNVCQQMGEGAGGREGESKESDVVDILKTSPTHCLLQRNGITLKG